ncbi:hypothetical protein BLNAU_12092 [Blattamonas nauphoetae]|uniref:Uncharacterized protein n=1 Tax=Blattamonas nauphoetae TaxID=2049346 RepID=A0ABQ9XRA7_9EUKA|nr:hypothetical protein BLNAU_12092 [Blattamonas nauphoetae]
MNTIIKTTDTCSSTTHSDLSSPHLGFPIECSSFLNWDESLIETEEEWADVFRSLVATLKFQPAFDVSLEEKAVEFFASVDQDDEDLTDPLLCSFAPTTDESLAYFIQYILVPISSNNRAIATGAMEMLKSLILTCSHEIHLALIEADLIPQLINTLNPQSLSFPEAVEIHTCIVRIISHFLWLATSDGLEQLDVEDIDEEQAVHETVLKEVLAPSEKYICHLCSNTILVVRGNMSYQFMCLLARLLQISPSYQLTMEFVLHMPIVLTIPSCLTLLEDGSSMWNFLTLLIDSQREWNSTWGEYRQRWKTEIGMLRMEGIDDVMEETLQTNDNRFMIPPIVAKSIEWNNLQGMNLPEQE